MTDASGTRAEPRPELDLAFPPKPEYVGTARHTLAALARMHGIPEDVVDDLKLAVSEACTNAVSTNASAGAEPSVRVTAAIDGESLVVDVADAGPGLDPAVLEREPEPSSEEFSFEHGLSLPLVRGLVDQVEIESGDGGGTVVRMRFSIRPVADPS